LHEWLEARRNNSNARPELKSGEAPEQQENISTRVQRLFNSLTKGLPEDRDTWTDEHRARWLLAHLIDYFRREVNTAWWEYYRLHELEHDDLLDERKAITGLEFVEALPTPPRQRVPVHRYRYPPQ